MIRILPKKRQTLILTLLGLILVLLMLYVFDQHRLDERSMGVRPDPSHGTGRQP